MKKEAKDAIAKHLEKEQNAVRSKIANNRYMLAKLAAEQTILKRQLGVYYQLLRSLK